MKENGPQSTWERTQVGGISFEPFHVSIFLNILIIHLVPLDFEIGINENARDANT